MPSYSFGELTTEITNTENEIYEMIDKGDQRSVNEAKDLVHELAETLRGILKDMDAIALRTPRHSRVNISNTNGPFQVGNGCVQTNQF